MGHGFREIIVDQHFSGKWTEVDMNLVGGHGTFQGTKFSDSAGGFSYKSSKYIVQNRFIYWRILNDMLELTESSMDYNLDDNQVRIVFPDSPIVSPIAIHETDTHVIILVVTVTSVNRFVFTHPTRTRAEDSKASKGNKRPSIFQQASLKPLMSFSNFSLFEQTINIPVPITAASSVVPHSGGYIFALSYESGSVTICKITKDDTFIQYDLRQANIFARILSSYTPSILKYGSNSISPDAVIGLSFFTAKVESDTRQKNLYLVTLSMNGHLRLHTTSNPVQTDGWIIVSDVLVDKNFLVAGHLDSTMTLRKFDENVSEYPKFAVFVPGEGFKIFDCLRNESVQGSPKLCIQESETISFKERSITDFCITPDFLFTLVSNPDEETDWEIKSHSFKFKGQIPPRFNLALLEPPPQADVLMNTKNTEPKEFYFNLIFNKCSFSVSTIYNALSMFKTSESFPKAENDWELTKFYAMRVIDSEIRTITAESDEPVADDDIYELQLKYWGEFYTSCVEYHINTVKPLGIFYEHNTKMLCIVKKARISFLRPTDFLETLLYFPDFVVSSDSKSDSETKHTESLIKYMEIMELLESSMHENYKEKIEKRISEDKKNLTSVWNEILIFLVETDPFSESVEQSHFIYTLNQKLRELMNYGDAGINILKNVIDLLFSWDILPAQLEVPMQIDDGQDSSNSEIIHVRSGVTQFLMGSRLGGNVTYRILKQLLNNRFMIMRNTRLLQSLIAKFNSESDNPVPINMASSALDEMTVQFCLLRCYSLQVLCERSGEFVHENWSENGLKVANLLNCRPSDQLVHGKIPDFWPIKLMELFCNSAVGGLAIRSRVNLARYSTVLAYADAAGRAIWTNDDDRPFEDFMISAGQYNALAYYATEIRHHFQSESECSVLKVFYQSISDFFIRSPEAALNRLIMITKDQLGEATYFCTKYLGFNPVTDNETAYVNAFFEKTINLFQIFGYTYGVQRLAEEALRSSIHDDRWIRIMSVLGFKSALGLGDYESAFNFILKMPQHSQSAKGQIVAGKERESSIRTFVTRILENRDIDVLVSLNGEKINSSIVQELERVLHAQAKLSDPLSEDSVYQMVYFYHLCQRNYEKAAMAMLERITQVGMKGRGRAALEIQRDAYLDILTCISLKKINEKIPQIGGAGDILNVDEFISQLEQANISTTESLPVEDHFEIKERVKSYENMLRECELCISLLLLTDDKEVLPLKYSLEKERADSCVRALIQIHQYDQAIKLATMWNISYLPILSRFSRICVNLVYNVKPASGDPADYVRYLQLNDLPNSNANVTDLAFMVLKNYIRKLEKPRETKLHKEVTLMLLRYHINLPKWLQDSYKKRDVNQLLLCYMRFGDWEEASSIAIDVIDDALGRKHVKEYDPSIQVCSAFQPIPMIPYNTIEDLADQMNQHRIFSPELEEPLNALKERCEYFVSRVLETRQERALLLGA